MPAAVLLNFDDPTFDFQHAMEHRKYYAVMAPLTRFSVMPYFIDPVPMVGRLPATGWPLNHQRAHNDFANSLPPYYAAPRVGIGLPFGQVLMDSDPSDPEARQWWTFNNHQQHYTASAAMSPPPTAVPPPTTPEAWFRGVTYPFW